MVACSSIIQHICFAAHTSCYVVRGAGIGVEFYFFPFGVTGRMVGKSGAWHGNYVVRYVCQDSLRVGGGFRLFVVYGDLGVLSDIRAPKTIQTASSSSSWHC